MNEPLSSSVSAPVSKVVSVWIAFGVTSWSDVAAIAAAFYSILLIGEWFYKRFWRDLFVRWGWVKPKLRRRDDTEDE